MTWRRLPVRVAPIPGEAIDSWLEATASRMDVSLGAVVGALNLPTAPRPIWLRWLSGEQLNAIETATGVSSSAVAAMSLGVYDGTAVQLDRTCSRSAYGRPSDFVLLVVSFIENELINDEVVRLDAATSL